MKKHNLLLVLPALLASQMCFAQSNHLTLSDNYPSASEKIKITYNPAGTPLKGKRSIAAKVYFIDGKDNPAADINLTARGHALTGNFTIPATAKAFFIKLFSAAVIDNNNDEGYVYLIYKDKKPVEGAYESKGFILSGLGNYFAKIKTDQKNSLALFKKEEEVHPASEKKFQTIYYQILSQQKDASAVTLVNKKIGLLEKSDKEKDLSFAANLLSWTRRKASSDSLNAIVKQRFPDGNLASSDREMEIIREKDLVKKDSLFKIYIGKYPEKADDKTSNVDYIKKQLAADYLKQGNIADADKYAAQVKHRSNLAFDYNNIAWDWVTKDEKLDEAKKVSKQTLEIAQECIKNPVAGSFTTLNEAKKNEQDRYDLYADTYAYILYKEKKYDEALQYQRPVYDRNPDYPEYGEHYALILNALGKYDAAKQIAEKVFKGGKGSPALADELKKAYVGLNGSETGYDKYFAGLTSALNKVKRDEIAKQMINTPASAFTLKDLDGNTVSLAALKGKTVIVDFWATWCGPCKASFPGMQMAVNKYKDDPNVKFLFVDTWEQGDNYADGVKKFIADNKYTFKVLLDEKGTDGRQSKVVSQFEVNGIPTKFIIDKNGMVRFKKVGFLGSADDLVSEITMMINLANEPQVAQVKSK